MIWNLHSWNKFKIQLEFANQASGSKEARIRGVVFTILGENYAIYRKTHRRWRL